MAASYYEVLGVAVTASAEDIRAAFRHRARQVHPDRRPASGSRFGGSHPGAGDDSAMRELNDAWRVLGDPARRRAYDRSLRAGAPAPGPAQVDPDDRPYVHPPAEPGDLGVSFARGLPWAAAIAVLVAIFVFTAYAGGGDDDGVSASDLVGECIRLERGGVVSAVPCAERNSGRVDLVTVRASLCPDESSPVRLPSQGSWLCLRDASES